MDKQNRAARKKFHYIYVTTCKVTGRYYIGMHSTDDLNDGYIGSGKRLWSSIKKHGREQHICEVLEFLPTRTALRLREAEHVNEERLKQDPFCMNLKIGGEGGWDHQNSNSEIQRAKCQKGNLRQAWLRLHDEKWKETDLLMRQQLISDLQRQGKANNFSIRPYDWTGKQHKSEVIEKMKETAKGKNIGEQNPMYGKKHSPETIAKMKAAAVRKCHDT